MKGLFQYLNQHSFTLLALLIWIVLAGVLRRRGGWPVLLALTVVAGALVATWYAVRPRPTPMGEAAAIQAQIGRGTPVLLEFQSPY